MILVFGGAYNGKLEFVKEKYSIDNEDIYFCNGHDMEYDKKVICGLHIFTKECVKNGINAVDVLRDNLEYLEDKIIISDEICSGIVPMEKSDRAWREESGRALQFLSNNSSQVYRIFFGIEEVLKDIV